MRFQITVIVSDLYGKRIIAKHERNVGCEGPVTSRSVDTSSSQRTLRYHRIVWIRHAIKWIRGEQRSSDVNSFATQIATENSGIVNLFNRHVNCDRIGAAVSVGNFDGEAIGAVVIGMGCVSERRWRCSGTANVLIAGGR